MKITDIGKIRNSETKKTRKAGAGDAAMFSALLSAAEADDVAAPLAPATVRGAGLMGLQEVDSERQAQQQHVARGHDLLSHLDEIRHGLLLGTLAPQKLRAITALLQERPTALQDPRLAAIVQEIEVRAAVELAKLEKPL